MSARSKVLYEDDRIQIVKRSSNGVREKAHISITMSKPEGMHWSRAMKLDLDELFDLAEVLDDVCDAIEDREDELRAEGRDISK